MTIDQKLRVVSEMDSKEFQVRGRQMVDFIIQYLEVNTKYKRKSVKITGQKRTKNPSIIQYLEVVIMVVATLMSENTFVVKKEKNRISSSSSSSSSTSRTSRDVGSPQQLSQAISQTSSLPHRPIILNHGR